MKTLEELLAELNQGGIYLANRKTLECAINEAQAEFISAVTAGDMPKLRLVAKKIYDGTEAIERLYANDAGSLRWIRPFTVLADTAQRLYEIMKPKIEAEKLLETNLGRRIIRSLYDREISWIDLKCELGADHYEFTDATKTFEDGGLIVCGSRTGDGYDDRNCICHLTSDGHSAAEKMFPELKLSSD